MTFAPPAPTATPAASSRSGLGIALAGAAVLVVAGIAWWAMRPGRVDTPPPAVEPTAAVMAPVAASVAESASAALPAPEPAASAPGPSPVTAPSNTAVPGTATQAASTPAVRPLPTARPASMPSIDAKTTRDARPAPRLDNTPPPPATAQSTEPLPVRPPRPALSPPVTTPSVPTNTAPATAKPQDPREVCGGRVFIALDICMERECKKPGSSGHAECVNWRKEKEERDRYGR